MSIRSCRTTRSLRDVDLPILPFLAPRAFGFCPEYSIPAKHAVSFTSRARRTPEPAHRHRCRRSVTALQGKGIAQPALNSRSASTASAQHGLRDPHSTVETRFPGVDSGANRTSTPRGPSCDDGSRPRNRTPQGLPLRSENPPDHPYPVAPNPPSLLKLEQSFDRLYANYKKLKLVLSNESPSKSSDPAKDAGKGLKSRAHERHAKDAMVVHVRSGIEELREMNEELVRKQNLRDRNDTNNHEVEKRRKPRELARRINAKTPHLSWTTTYQNLYLAREHGLHHQADLGLAHNAPKWAAELCQEGMRVSSLREKWKTVPLRTKLERWPHIVLWSLVNAPDAVPAIVEATYEPNAWSLAMVTDCLLYLDRFHETEDFLGRYRTDGFHSLAFSILDWNTQQRWVSHHSRLWNILVKYCTDGEAPRVFDSIVELGQMIDLNSLLHLMGRFTEAKRFDYAIKVLEHLAAQGVDLSNNRILRSCTSLLKKSSSTSGLTVLSRVLKAGIQPNHILNNVILSNAFKAQGSDIGWNVFNHLLANDFKPDEVTYFTLVEDAMNRSDSDLLQKLYGRISVDDSLQKSETLLSFCMHAIRHLDKIEYPHERHDLLPILFPMFARVHDIQPLRDLRIIPDEWDFPQGATLATDPTAPTLSIMIAAYLHSQTDPETVLALYNRFRDLVVARHPSIIRLTRTAHTYGLFKMALYRHAAYLPQCIQILEDMLAPLPVNLTSLESPRRKELGFPNRSTPYYSSPDQISASEPSQLSHFDDTKQVKGTIEPHCKPSIYTWNMLLLAFMYHDQPASVEKVRAMMLKRGIHFNQVCWNVWIRGMAGMNTTEKVMNALDEMEKEGLWFGFDDWKRQKGSKGMQSLNRILQNWLKMKEERTKTLEWTEEMPQNQTGVATDATNGGRNVDQNFENREDQTQAVPEGRGAQPLKPLLEKEMADEKATDMSSSRRPLQIKRISVWSPLDGLRESKVHSMVGLRAENTASQDLKDEKGEAQNVPQICQGTSFSPRTAEEKMHEDLQSTNTMGVVNCSLPDKLPNQRQTGVDKANIKDKPVKIPNVGEVNLRGEVNSIHRLPLSLDSPRKESTEQDAGRQMKNQGPRLAPPDEQTMNNPGAARKHAASGGKEFKALKTKRRVGGLKHQGTSRSDRRSVLSGDQDTIEDTPKKNTSLVDFKLMVFPRSKEIATLRHPGPLRTTPHKSISKLTEEDKTRYRGEGRCLRCRNLGHSESDPACPLYAPAGITYVVPEKYHFLPELRGEDISRFHEEGRCVRCRELGHSASDPDCPFYRASGSSHGGSLVRFSLSERRSGR